MKYLKYQKNAISCKINYDHCLKFGVFGVKAVENGELTERQINLIEKLFFIVFKKNSKLWVRVFANYPKTCRPLGSRMGSGKGSVIQFIAKIKKGQILFEWVTTFSDLNMFFVKKIFSKFAISSICITKGL